MVSNKKFTLNKRERLSSKVEIDHLFSIGKKYHSNSTFIIVCPALENKGNKVIFIASKRIFPKAYQRNRAKRLLKEAYRLNKHLIQDKLGKESYFIGIGISKDGLNLSNIEEGLNQFILKYT